MTGPQRDPAAARIRREPPRFRRVAVRSVTRLGARMVRVTLGGPDLDGFTVEQPAASVRLLLPAPGEREVVIPTWNGNEFLLDGGRRPTIRTFTPLRVDHDVLDLEIVVHGAGAASEWAEAAEPGAVVAISGPGRGYAVDAGAPAFLLAGDETAIPAITELLERLPESTPIAVLIEVADPDGRLPLPEHPRAAVEWCDLAAGRAPGDALVAAVRAAALTEATRVWAAGEAASVQRIRRHLFEDRKVPRTNAVVRGYWKYGRSGDTDAT